MPKKDKQSAIYEISMVDFLLVDLKLYLDTHPTDRNALDYYKHYAKVLKELREEYVCNFGPLFAEDSNCETCFEWAKVPNAWEGVCQFMFQYEKRLQFPVKITRPDAKTAMAIISQFGGPDGELAASMRYFSQRYAMPYREVGNLLTDIATEELAHLEMVGAIVHQLTKDLSMEEIKKSGFDKYYVDHTVGLWPQAAGGVPFNANQFQSKGDILTDLFEDMAAEQKARTTYDNILRLIDNPEVIAPIRFLRQREIVHFQRFGEALRIAQDKLNEKNFYAFNPGFDCNAN